jgi:hypothetical protein
MADTLVSPLTGAVNKISSYLGGDTVKRNDWTEPESSLTGVYPYTNVTQTESGHAIIMEDTKGSETVRIQHRGGNFVEMQANGDQVQKILGNGYEIIAKDNNVMIKGQCNITVEGSATMQVYGDVYQRVGGNLKQHVLGNAEQVVAGEVRIACEEDVEIVSGTNITLTAENVDIKGDLNVDGEVTSGNIFSNGNINALLRVHATVGVETLGWVSAGFPNFAGYPGQIKGIMVHDIVSTMMMDRLRFLTHFHIGNRGFPTSLPISPISIL